jgi:tetratricopeptide (TPR) repeat protein
MRNSAPQYLLVALLIGLSLLVVIANDRRERRKAARAKLDPKTQAADPPRRLLSGWVLVFVLLALWGVICFLSPNKNQPAAAVRNLSVTLVVALAAGAAFAVGVGIILVMAFRYYDRGVNRAIDQANAGDLDGAIRELWRQIEEKGLSAARANGLGCLLINQKDWQGALKMLDEAERLGMSRTWVGANRGLALMKAGDAKAALPLLEEAVQGDPNGIVCRCNLCFVLAELGRSEEARVQLSRIEQMRKQQARMLAFTSAAMMQIDQTIEKCRERLAGEPKDDLAGLDEF